MLLFFLLTILAPGELGNHSLLSQLPDDTSVVLYASHPLQSYQEWKISPLARLFADPAMAPFLHSTFGGFNPLDEQALEQETGIPLSKLKPIMTGSVLFALRSSFLEDQRKGLLLAAEVTATEDEINALRLSLRKEGEQPRQQEIATYQGINLHLLYDKADPETLSHAWAIRDGRFLVCDSLDALKQAVDRYASGAPANPALAKIATNHAHLDGFVYLSLPSVLASAVKAIPESGPFPPQTIIDTMGISSIETITLGLDFSREHCEIQAAMSYTSKKGLLGLLAFPPGRAKYSSLVPAFASIFSSGSWDVQEAWKALEEWVRGLDPQLPTQLGMQLDAFATASGTNRTIDLRQNILEVLGRDWVNYHFPLDGSLAGVSLVSIADAAKMAEGMADLAAVSKGAISAFGTLPLAIEVVEGMEKPTWRFSILQSEEKVVEAFFQVTPSHLVIATPNLATLEKAVKHIQSPGKSAFQRPEVSRTLNSWSGEPVVLGYGEFTPAMLEMALSALKSLASLEKNAQGSAHLEKLPEAAVLSRLLGPFSYATYATEGNIRFSLRLLAPATP